MNVSLRLRQVLKGGFTLIEMLTATAVLILILALIIPMFNSLTSTTARSTETLAVDVVARQVLDRMGRDLAMMPLRQDLDYFLVKRDGNDEFNFLTRVPGVLPSGADTSPASGLTLVGYRVVDGNLERMAVAQPFDALTFLTHDSAGQLVSNTGITRAMATTTDVNYHIHGQGVFRFELGFLLKDGSYATLPMDTSGNPGSSEPGFRRWTTSANHNFAEVTVPDGPGNVTWRALSWQDVTAIVVTLAVIDPVHSGRFTLADLQSAAAQFADAEASTNVSNLILTGTVWTNTLETPGSVGLPQTSQNAIQVYQRTFFLNSP
jgi:type II secretory pathway component PulJ